MKQLVALVLGLALIVQGTAARAAEEESGLAQVGYGAGSVLGTLVYAPFKATFCILGGLSSGVALIFDRETAGKMASASCLGTWVITPDAVRGKETVRFVGKTS